MIVSCIQERLLRVLSKSRSGMTSNQLYRILGEEDEIESFRAILSKAVNSSYVRVDGKMSCGECAAQGKCYRITEKGRIYLVNRDERRSNA